MSLDPNLLMISLLFGAVGTALFLYGKNAQKLPHLVAGVALCVCPYFISNMIALCVVCVLLTIAPFVMPET